MPSLHDGIHEFADADGSIPQVDAILATLKAQVAAMEEIRTGLVKARDAKREELATQLPEYRSFDLPNGSRIARIDGRVLVLPPGNPAAES